MKILYFSPTYSPITHGPALTAQILAKIPGSHSFEIRIVSESFEYEKPPNAYLIKIPNIRIFHAWGKWIRMWCYHKKAKEIYKEYSFDYLMFNDALLGLFSSFALRNAKIQVWGFCNDSAYMKLATNVNKGKLSFLMDCLHAVAEFGMMHLADGIFTCSEYLRQRAILFYKVKKEKIKCLYPGISLDFWHFKEREFNQINTREEILFVKSDYKNGGLSVLLKALLRLKRYSFRLHLVGTPVQQEANLQRLLSKFPSINILTYGQLSPFKVRDLMYQCDTLCIPSLNEGFGIVNVEGLATGISVVSTLTGGIPEVLSFEKYGWTVPPDNPFALAEMIESCWKNKEERLRRSKEGRKMVETHFTSQLLQDNFIKCLLEK